MKALTKQKTKPKQSTEPVKPGALKLKDSARYLGGVSQITVRRAIERGLIKPCRSLRHLLIPIRELDRFLSEGQEQSPANRRGRQ